MNQTSQGGDWDVVFKPRLGPRLAYIAAVPILLAGILAALPMKSSTTGAVYRTADQVALVGLAGVLAGALVLVLTRPRVKAGRAGLSVRNAVEEHLIPWSEVRDVSFPAGKRWARVELDYDEYLPLVAIQSVDREHAVRAMNTLRTLMERYRPD